MDNVDINSKKKKTRGQKKALVVGIIAGILAVSSITLSVVFSQLSPKATNLTGVVKGNNYYGLTNYENGDWAYGDENGNYYTYNYKDELIDTINLKTFIGVDVDERIDHVFREINADGSYSDTCWLTTVGISATDSNYLIKATKDSKTSKLTFQQKAKSDTTIDYVLSTDQYVYIATWDNSSRTRIDKFEKSDIEKNSISSGFLYEAKYLIDDEGNPCVDYIYRQKARVFAMAESGDNLYVATQNGINKMNKNFSYNKFMTTLKKDYDKKTKYISASQSTDGKDHLYFYYDDTGETVSKHYCEALGPTDFVGGGYDKSLNKFVIPTSLGEIRELTPDGIDSMITGEIISNEVVKKTGISYSSRFRNADLHNAITYDPIKHRGVLEFQDSTTVSLIDTEKNKAILSCPANFDIFGMIINDKTGRLYFSNRTSNVFGIAHEDMYAMSKSGLYKGLFIASIVTAIITGITSIISFIGYSFKGYMKRIVATGKNMKKNYLVYLIMIPSMVLLFMFCYYPAVGSINLSFYNYTSAVPRMEWNTFAHYASIFTSPDTWVMFGNTLFFLVFDLILAFVPPLIFAFFLTVMRSKKYSGIIRTLLFLTSIVPGITSILIWKEAFFATEGGLLNSIAGLFGAKVQWLTDSAVSRWSLVLMGFPFIGSYLIFYGAMMNIPSSYYEAAELDGITVVKRFFKIDLPLIIPQLKYVFIMTFIHSIQNFSRLYVLYGKTGASYVPKTLIYEMYTLFKSSPVDYGKAAAYATIIFILLFGFTFMAFRTKRKDMEA